jgi:hypothetical protein
MKTEESRKKAGEYEETRTREKKENCVRYDSGN